MVVPVRFKLAILKSQPLETLVPTVEKAKLELPVTANLAPVKSNNSKLVHDSNNAYVLQPDERSQFLQMASVRPVQPLKALFKLQLVPPVNIPPSILVKPWQFWKAVFKFLQGTLPQFNIFVTLFLLACVPVNWKLSRGPESSLEFINIVNVPAPKVWVIAPAPKLL